MHILESLSTIGDFKGVELPTRDQISNRIHGRESKKRKLQIESTLNQKYPTQSLPTSYSPSLSLQDQQEEQEEQQLEIPTSINEEEEEPPVAMPQPPVTIPNRIDHGSHPIDSYEQTYLDMFGPQLLYHSVFFPEYGLGMVVTSPTDVPMPSYNSPYTTNGDPSLINNPPTSLFSASTYSSIISPHYPCVSSSASMNNQNRYTPSFQSSSTLVPAVSTSMSVPLAGSSIPMTIQPHYPQKWTLLFLHTPPDRNGIYMRCQLGCPGCVNGKIHVLVSRTLLLAGLMGAVEIANCDSYSPDKSNQYQHNNRRQQPHSQHQYQQYQYQQSQQSQMQQLRQPQTSLQQSRVQQLQPPQALLHLQQQLQAPLQKLQVQQLREPLQKSQVQQSQMTLLPQLQLQASSQQSQTPQLEPQVQESSQQSQTQQLSSSA